MNLTHKSDNARRGAFYVDGFNLYHAINDLAKPYLKWVNLWKLSQTIARGHARTVEKVVFCTAFFPGDHGKKKRHQTYIAAQEMHGVECRLGHTTREPMQCKQADCGHRWDAPREKETDINLALAAFEDAHDDIYDVAFIITADTDQAATLKRIRHRFPTKRLITVVPPGRPPSKHLKDLSHATIKLTQDHLDDCVMRGLLTKEGFRSIQRPKEYTPPLNWFHPDDRCT